MHRKEEISLILEKSIFHCKKAYGHNKMPKKYCDDNCHQKRSVVVEADMDLIDPG